MNKNNVFSTYFVAEFKYSNLNVGLEVNQKTIKIRGLLRSKFTNIADGYLIERLLLTRPIAMKHAIDKLRTIVNIAS